MPKRLRVGGYGDRGPERPARNLIVSSPMQTVYAFSSAKGSYPRPPSEGAAAREPTARKHHSKSVVMRVFTMFVGVHAHHHAAHLHAFLLVGGHHRAHLLMHDFALLD